MEDCAMWSMIGTKIYKKCAQVYKLEERIKKLRAIKCPPISDGDSCICPIEELEHKNQLLQITIAEALEECIGEDIEKATIILEQKDND